MAFSRIRHSVKKYKAIELLFCKNFHKTFDKTMIIWLALYNFFGNLAKRI